jgi:multiple sugar transport system ATP-binding protein
MASVKVRQLVKKYDQNIAVNQLDLTIEDGEFVVFLGPSGCGKTTTLRCIAGLEIPDGGTIHIGNEEVTRRDPSERDIAMVFQSFSLYPHMTVRENLAFPLKAVKTPLSEITANVDRVAKVLHIERHLERKPSKLSGGEMQRVAIGRAIIRRPKVYLFDEPLSALDAKLRTEMRAEIKRLQTDLGATLLYVTHDQLEAMSMADKIAIMFGGYLQQVGTPTEVYDTPHNLFVAGFIGSPAMNFLPCQKTNSGLQITRIEGTEGGESLSATISLDANGQARFAAIPSGTNTILGVRPEDVHLSHEKSTKSENSLPVPVYVVENLGSEKIINIQIAGHIVKARTTPTFHCNVGDTLWATIDQSRSHLFDAKTEDRLNGVDAGGANTYA